ncbi:MAG: hypothetical protein M3548_21035, partial [Actinomycetota bacterium]|nr:hypothetical protein [Actinomycetota bacterium]
MPDDNDLDGAPTPAPGGKRRAPEPEQPRRRRRSMDGAGGVSVSDLVERHTGSRNNLRPVSEDSARHQDEQKSEFPAAADISPQPPARHADDTPAGRHTDAPQDSEGWPTEPATAYHAAVEAPTGRRAKAEEPPQAPAKTGRRRVPEAESGRRRAPEPVDTPEQGQRGRRSAPDEPEAPRASLSDAFPRATEESRPDGATSTFPADDLRDPRPGEPRKPDSLFPLATPAAENGRARRSADPAETGRRGGPSPADVVPPARPGEAGAKDVGGRPPVGRPTDQGAPNTSQRLPVPGGAAPEAELSVEARRLLRQGRNPQPVVIPDPPPVAERPIPAGPVPTVIPADMVRQATGQYPTSQLANDEPAPRAKRAEASAQREAQPVQRPVQGG